MTYDGAMWLMAGAIVAFVLMLAGVVALNPRHQP